MKESIEPYPAMLGLLQSLNIGVALVSKSDGNIIYENPRFKEFTTLKMTSSCLYQRFPALKIDQVIDTIDRSGRFTQELSLSAKDARKIVSLEISRPDASDMLLVQCIDLTKQKESDYMVSSYSKALEDLNEQLADTLARYKKMSKFQSDFYATFGHDVKAPLYQIISIAHNGYRVNELEKHKRLFVMAESCANNLLSYMTNFIDFNKQEFYERVPKPTTINLFNVIRDCIEIHKYNTKLKCVDFFVIVDPAVPAEFKVKNAGLQQVLSNLIDNSCKYTDYGEILLRINTDRQDNKRIEFSVEDTGIGILEEDLKHLTEPYFVINSKQGGSGLGLSIVKKLLTDLETELKVQSKPGEGSRFSFSLRTKGQAFPIPPPARQRYLIYTNITNQSEIASLESLLVRLGCELAREDGAKHQAHLHIYSDHDYDKSELPHAIANRPRVLIVSDISKYEVVQYDQLYLVERPLLPQSFCNILNTL